MVQAYSNNTWSKHTATTHGSSIVTAANAMDTCFHAPDVKAVKWPSHILLKHGNHQSLGPNQHAHELLSDDAVEPNLHSLGGKVAAQLAKIGLVPQHRDAWNKPW